MDKTPEESKKFRMGVYGIIAVLLAGTGAAMAGPVGIAVLPYVIGGITAIAGSQIVTQGAQDVADKVANKKNPAPPDAGNAPVVPQK